MTESSRPRRPGFGPVLWGSVALFALLFVLLTYQLAAATEPEPRPVVQRKVIKRRVVTTVVPSPGAPVESGGEPAESSSPSEAPPVETAPPVEAAPPVTTSAS